MGREERGVRKGVCGKGHHSGFGSVSQGQGLRVRVRFVCAPSDLVPFDPFGQQLDFLREINTHLVGTHLVRANLVCFQSNLV